MSKRMFEKSNLLLIGTGAATQNFTHLRELKTLDFLLVHSRGLRLCSSEFYDPVGQFARG
jgi:hypothetical protein